MESEFFIESFFFNLSSFIKIDDIPFLVKTTMVLPDNSWLSFDILSA
jgi:hypothetical protein